MLGDRSGEGKHDPESTGLLPAPPTFTLVGRPAWLTAAAQRFFTVLPWAKPRREKDGQCL
jgi:hypothetical protein